MHSADTSRKVRRIRWAFRGLCVRHKCALPGEKGRVTAMRESKELGFRRLGGKVESRWVWSRSQELSPLKA